MLVYKIIFRLDFNKVNFDIIDRPGALMRAIDGAGEKFWSEYQDSKATRSIRGHYKKTDGGLFRQLSVEPTALDFIVEDAGGIQLGNLENHESYGTIFKTIHEICEQFKIDELKRAGIRFVALGSIGKDSPRLSAVFESLFEKKLISIIDETIGKAEDHGLALDGMADDKIKYHMRCGPYQSKESTRYFENVGQKMADATQANFVCDLDLYEEGFALKGNRAITWTKPLVQKAIKLTDGIEKFVVSKMN